MYIHLSLSLCSIMQILEYTPDTDPDYESLLLALQASETLCSQVNDGVRAKENAESLEWLQSHVHVTLNEVQTLPFHMYKGYSPWFFQKMAPKSPQIFITFSDTYRCPYAV